MKYLYIAYGMMWLSMAIAVSVGIYYTHSIHCLWFMLIPTVLIPTVVSFHAEPQESEDNNGTQP